jgi:hypothetical protein
MTSCWKLGPGSGKSPTGTSGASDFPNQTKEAVIISVEKCYPTLAQRCYDMTEGESVYLSPAEIPYDIHRYRDGWHAFWKSPPNGQIGRQLTSREELCFFLNGKWAVGRPIRNMIGLRRYLSEEPEE